MDDTINNFITPLSLSIGFVVCMFFMELFCLFGGGLVVPGYIALKINEPFSMILTISVSLLTYFLIQLLGKVTLLYGRRKYMLLLSVSFLIGLGINFFLNQFGHLGNYNQYDILEIDEILGVIGLIIPGLIAYWFDRQGILVTCATLITTAGIVRLSLVILLGTF